MGSFSLVWFGYREKALIPGTLMVQSDGKHHFLVELITCKHI